MKIVIAPDSFKGSLSSTEVSAAVGKGIKNANIDAKIVKIPMADGGEGTVEALVEASGGKLKHVNITGPLGDKVNAFYGILGDGKTAVIEMAAASGLPLVPDDKKNPLETTTFGTGELIADAIDNNCSRLIIGIGGSATNDGGMGMAMALGVIFLDSYGNRLGLGGKELEKISSIDVSGIDARINNVDIQVACDVTNPLCGKEGASYVFGPQKGATPDIVTRLDKGLLNYSKVINEELEIDIKDLPGSGAAGGLGGGLVAFLNATLKRGIDIVIDASSLEDKIKNADLVITGEGKTDGQTMYGKVPFGVAQIAKKYSVPVVCLSGALIEGYQNLYSYGITAFFSTANKEMSLKEAMDNASTLIMKASENIIRLFVSNNKQ